MSGGTKEDPVTVINSAFQKLLEDVKKYVVDKFGKLSPDISQFYYINGEKPISLVIDNWLKKQVLINSDVKDEEFGIGNRLRGCAAVRQKRYVDSIPDFNRSLRYSVYGSMNYILAKENRSEALYNLKEYADCIEDCDYVLEHLQGNEPDIVAGIAKVMLRKMKCCVRLKKFASAITVYESASGMASGLLRHQKDEWESELQAAKNGFAQPADNADDDLSNAIPPLAGGESTTLPFASSHLTLKSVTKTNKKVVTTKDLKVGDVLFAEEPFAVLLMHYESMFDLDEFCSRCCKKVKYIQPCTNCPIDVYCSAFCQQSAWESYHKWECKVGDIFSKLGPASLAFRMTCLSYNNSFDPQYLKRASELYYETERLNPEMYFMYSVLTAMLVRYLLEHTEFIEKVGNNDTMKVAVNIFQSLLQVIFNGQLITKSANIGKSGVAGLMDQSTFASAVYLSTSMMNHSCDANTYITFLNSHMIVRASRDIKKGQEITNSYGVNFRLYTREERLDRLRQYCFECKCIKCKEVDKPEFIHQSVGFICKHCDGPVTRRGCGQSIRLTCLKCHRTRFDELAEVIETTEDLYEYGMTMMDKTPRQALNYLQECRVRRLECYPPTSKAIAEVYAAIAQAYAYLDQTKERDQYVQSYTNYIEDRYGPVSLDLAHHFEKIGLIICQAIKKNEGQVSKIERKEVECALELFKRARWIVSVTYGPYEPYKHVDTFLNKKIIYAQSILTKIDKANNVECTNESPRECEVTVELGQKPLQKADICAGRLVPTEDRDANKGELVPTEGGDVSAAQLGTAEKGDTSAGELVPVQGGDTSAGQLAPDEVRGAGTKQTVPAEGGDTGTDQLVPAEKVETGAGGLVPTKGGDTGAGQLVHAEGGDAGIGRTVPAEGGDTGTDQLVPAEKVGTGAGGLVPAEGGDTGAAQIVPAEKVETCAGGLVPTQGGDTGAGQLVPTVGGDAGIGQIVPAEDGDIGAGGLIPVQGGDTSAGQLAPDEVRDAGTDQTVPAEGGYTGTDQLVPAEKVETGVGGLVPVESGDTGAERIVPAEKVETCAGGLVPTKGGDTGAGQLVPAEDGDASAGVLVSAKDGDIGTEQLDSVEGLGAEGQQSSHGIIETSDKLVLNENALKEKLEVSNSNDVKEDKLASTGGFTTVKQ